MTKEARFWLTLWLSFYRILLMKCEALIIIGLGICVITLFVCIPLSKTNELWLLPILFEGLIIWVLLMIGLIVKMPREMQKYMRGE